jgi:uncharacterized protein (TIGR02186 family)
MRWLLVFLLLAAPALAQPDEPLVARLSQDRVEVSTTFDGASILVFGSTAQPIGPGGAEILIVTRGPEHPFTVRRKVRVLGMWFNGPSARFTNVPAFYSVAGTLPAWRLLPEALRAQNLLGLDMLPLASTGARAPQFRAALLELKQRAGLWQEDAAPVEIGASRLFSSRLPLPATIPAGEYRVQVLLVESRRVVAREELTFLVERIGTAATIADVAQGQPLLYGVICVFLAALAGWLGSVVFRRS